MCLIVKGTAVLEYCNLVEYNRLFNFVKGPLCKKFSFKGASGSSGCLRNMCTAVFFKLLRAESERSAQNSAELSALKYEGLKSPGFVS